MSEKKYNVKLDQIEENLKEGFGKITGDGKLEIEGFAEKTTAKGKELASDVKEGVEGVVEGVEKTLHKDN